MKKTILTLLLAIGYQLSAIPAHAGTNAAITINTNTFLVSPTNLWRTNAAGIIDALTNAGFTGGGGGSGTNTYAVLTNSGQINAGGAITSKGGISNYTSYFQTNLVTGSFVTIPTNGHLHVTDEHGSTYDFLTNGTLQITNTNGNFTTITNGVIITGSNNNLVTLSNGNAYVAGAVSAGTVFIGNQADITNNAGLSIAQQIAAAVTNIPGVVTNTQTNLTLSGTFAGNGSGLTNTGAPSSWNVSFWGDSLTCCGGTGGPYGNLCTNYISTILPIVEGFSGQNSSYISNYFSTNQSQWSNTTVFWAGRNDTGFAGSVPATVLANTSWMVSQLLLPSNYIVLGLLTSTNDTAPTIANYLACNVILSNAFWPHYIDTHAMLQANASGVGTNDAYYVSQGWTPLSLLATGDGLHLNASGYNLVASNVCLLLSNQFYSRPVRMSSLPSLVSNYVVPVSGLAKATINPYIFLDSGGLQAEFGNNAANELLQFSTASFAYPNAALFGNNSQTWLNGPVGGVVNIGLGGNAALSFNGNQITPGSGWLLSGQIVTNSTFYGNGAGLTNLPASTNAALLNAAQTFTGNNTFTNQTTNSAWVVFGGVAPTIATNVGGSAGGLTVGISGKDQAGIISFGGSTSTTADVAFLTVTFGVARPDTNYVVDIRPLGVTGGGQEFTGLPYVATNTATGWQVTDHGSVNLSGKTATYFYFIAPWH